MRGTRFARRTFMPEMPFVQLFQGSPVAMSLSRMCDGLVLEVNDAYLETFGVRREQIVGHTPADAGVIPISHERDSMLVRLQETRSIHVPELTVLPTQLQALGRTS